MVKHTADNQCVANNEGQKTPKAGIYNPQTLDNFSLHSKPEYITHRH